MWRQIRERSTSRDGKKKGKKLVAAASVPNNLPTQEYIQYPTVKAAKREANALEAQLASLHDEMKSLRVECDRLIHKHLKADETQQQGSHLGESSSAYNTGGDSCRSASVTPEGTLPVMTSSLHSPPKCPSCIALYSNPPTPSIASTTSRPTSAERRQRNMTQRVQSTEMPVLVVDPTGAVVGRSHVPISPPIAVVPPILSLHPSDSVSSVKTYQSRNTIKENHSTNWKPSGSTLHIQSPKFRVPKFSIVARSPQVAPSTGQKHVPPQTSKSKPQPIEPIRQSEPDRFHPRLYMFDRPIDELGELSEGSAEEVDEQKEAEEQQPTTSKQEKGPVEYKWKVKRRCDGSRYVVKRPMRNQVLKKREAQLLRERTGISTDDDAMSGVKLGHFFNREERKRQLEHEKMRKIRQEEKINQAKEVITDKLIVDLAQRKMARRQAPLDGFVSTREYLSQRHSTTAQGPPPPAPILAVTTV
ncbi:unnamed protein product, partial [Mesorhabditis belari]|uniref:Uncharacterized protein n=1 Tax=Mesorhabditis belari TaxID=2138241 RepID=A0AAF3J9W3_9BILA